MKLKRIGRQLKRIKNKSYPKSPENVESIRAKMLESEIGKDYGYTKDGLHNLYIDSVINENYSFCLFASFKTIEVIKNEIEPDGRHYLMDGTFKVAPKGFLQLLIISIEYKNDVCIKLNHIGT